ncbi:hypothetical protein GCM10007977_031320 [Dactylosporangium sucinum]|uniref:Uncharacterized protein n=1 Tax=Dactylosporangium sucinum TaxID=1424081 RepID=A0A917TLL8_9ACTN|nr:hypothetical protein GCM10007977_031320 [Dactylosporangium sucinum]
MYDAMYDAIDERNATITALRADHERVKGQRIVGPATQHRIHATLRKALNDAIRRHRLIDTNPALTVELPDGPGHPSPPSGPTNASRPGATPARPPAPS